MPAIRDLNIRRSRRLSRLPPRSDSGNADCWEDIELALARIHAPTRPSSDQSLSSPVVSDQHILNLDPLQSPPIPQSHLHGSVSAQSSHSRKKGQGHVPRPPNAFMCFRSDLWAKEKHKADVERDHRMISRIAGYHWNQLSEEERAPYKRQAEAAKRRHAEIYPEYKYAPVYREKPTSTKRRSFSSSGGEQKRCQTELEVFSPALADVSGTPVHVVRDIKEEVVETTLPALAMSVKAKRPTHRRKLRSAHTKRAPRSLPLPPSPSPEAAHTPVLTRAESEPPAQHVYIIVPDEEFVPTDEVPPLDLNETGATSNQAKFSDDGKADQSDYAVTASNSIFSRSTVLASSGPSSDTMLAELYWRMDSSCFSGSPPQSPSLSSRPLFNDAWNSDPSLAEDEVLTNTHFPERPPTWFFDISSDNNNVNIFEEWIHEDESDSPSFFQDTMLHSTMLP